MSNRELVSARLRPSVRRRLYPRSRRDANLRTDAWFAQRLVLLRRRPRMASSTRCVGYRLQKPACRAVSSES